MFKKIYREDLFVGSEPDNQGKTGLALIGEEEEKGDSVLKPLQRARNLTNCVKNASSTSNPSDPSRESFFYSEMQKSDCSIFPPPKADADARGSSSEEGRKSHILNGERQRMQNGFNSHSLEKLRRPECSPHLVALSELEFRKSFLILSYCGKKKLEDYLSLEAIQRMKNLPMTVFESELWKVMGCRCVEKTDRRENLDWNSENTFMYHCHVDPAGNHIFKGPYLQPGKTHLHRVLGDDNVLLVKFEERRVGANSSSIISNSSNNVYQRVGKEGILVGLRHYRFFVYKDGGKEEKKKNSTSSAVKCYFVCMGSSSSLDERNPPSLLFNKCIFEARSVFMHIHKISTVAKYMARFSLILSKTIKLEIDLASVHIERIEDQPCRDQNGKIVNNEDGEARIHTDGTGFISEDLALKCPRHIAKGKYISQGDFQRLLDRIASDKESSQDKPSRSYFGDPPLLIQIRLFYNGSAVKGTLLVNKKLPPKTIQIRPSMIKVESDPELLNAETANSLEIVSTSNPPKKAYLSKYLIAHLTYGGVPREYFLNLLTNALDDAQNGHYNKHAALRVSLRYGEMDDFLVPRMLLSGIPIDEPYLQERLSVLLREEKKSLKGGKLPVTECYNLMGTADPTGLLKRDQVCVILDDGQISGKVLVYKHPGLHFGDIHVLNAVYVKELEEVVGNAKYAIFFPTKGSRSVADEIANSDFDGDSYWVSRNPQLLDFKPSSPWLQTYMSESVPHQKVTNFSPEELENELFQQFLTTRFNPSYSTGQAAECWLGFMDRLLTLGEDCFEEKVCMKEKMLQLVDIYYDALDAPKTGKKVEVPRNLRLSKFPHFMGRADSYHSRSILGQIYDKVEAFQTTEAEKKEVWKLPLFSGKVPASCVWLWKERYDQYRVEMTHALGLPDDVRDEAAEEVMLKYKKMLYDETELSESKKKREEIYNEALAIYHIVYDYAKISGVGKCGFAWRVAGHALCELYAKTLCKDPIICSPSVLRELLN